MPHQHGLILQDHSVEFGVRAAGVQPIQQEHGDGVLEVTLGRAGRAMRGQARAAEDQDGTQILECAAVTVVVVGQGVELVARDEATYAGDHTRCPPKPLIRHRGVEVEYFARAGPHTSNLLLGRHAYRGRAGRPYQAPRRADSRIMLAQLRRMERELDAIAALHPQPQFDDFHPYNEHDRVFHDVLVTVADNRVLLETYRSLAVQMQLARLYHDRSAIDYGESMYEHRAIYDVLQQRDLDGAAAVRAHIEGVERRLGAFLDDD